MAPEVFVGEYDKKCDIWSLGLIIFEMTFGYSLFRKFRKTLDLMEFLTRTYNDSEMKKLLEENCKKKTISAELSDLIRQCMRKDPIKRISIDEITKHPWFKDLDKQKSHDKTNIILGFLASDQKKISKNTSNLSNNKKTSPQNKEAALIEKILLQNNLNNVTKINIKDVYSYMLFVAIKNLREKYANHLKSTLRKIKEFMDIKNLLNSCSSVLKDVEETILLVNIKL